MSVSHPDAYCTHTRCRKPLTAHHNRDHDDHFGDLLEAAKLAVKEMDWRFKVQGSHGTMAEAYASLKSSIAKYEARGE